MRYARGVGGAAAREIKALYQPATWLIESINWRAGIIPIRENADWYARGVGGAAARETKALYQPATWLIESINWRAGISIFERRIFRAGEDWRGQLAKQVFRRIGVLGDQLSQKRQRFVTAVQLG